MGRWQRVFFRIGAWACIVTSLIHLAGQLAGAPGPKNPTEETLFKLLTTYQRDVGAGFRRTTSDFLNGLSLCFSVFVAWVGVLSILAARRHGDDARFMTTISRICAVFSAAALVISVVYFFLPPTVCLAVVFLGFAGAALLPAEEASA